MEGLLPLVYKAIKKNRTRRQYEVISLGGSYNISMAEIHPQTQQPASDDYNIGHRRHKSVGDSFGNGFQFHDQTTTGSVSPSKKLVRFSSHRMFSCIKGA
ncbi:uncharacterized protein [Medicago truncatula]|uniref:Uncharacterized protein n=1 Tax=Medicago truncatula TaxID=3880 RepID=B7FGG5_MEDTR|nr:uncharacterized protein LOC11431218 [Medicago truncatula]ACJ83844.1 unknown [Medicago truncatula]AES72978.1 hypothetical protein MTR_3g098390 [Medicago truncatula]AFK40706.1 unknown [Medicago truncatula]